MRPEEGGCDFGCVSKLSTVGWCLFDEGYNLLFYSCLVMYVGCFSFECWWFWGSSSVWVSVQHALVWAA